MTRAKTQRTPSISKITNSKHEIRNSKQKGKTQNTNFKTFQNAGEVFIGRFWILRIEILKLFRISIFGFRIFPRSFWHSIVRFECLVCLRFRASDLGF